MATGRDIVRKALQKIGALDKSEMPDADEATDGLSALNAMLGSWSNETGAVFANTWESFNLIGGQQEYTIGAGGQFNTIRPNNITSAIIRITGVDYEMQPMTDEVYQTFIPLKSTQGIPEWYNYDNGYPLAKIRLFPVPAAAYEILLTSQKQLTAIGLDSNVELPPGWEEALIYNLGMRLSPEYGQPVSGDLAAIAQSSKRNIMLSQAQNSPMTDRPLSARGFNVYRGY